VAAQTAADIEAIAARHHDVQQKQRGRLALGVRNHVGGGVKKPRGKPSGFQVMLYQPRNISVVFQHKNGLAQRSALAGGR